MRDVDVKAGPEGLLYRKLRLPRLPPEVDEERVRAEVPRPPPPGGTASGRVYGQRRRPKVNCPPPECPAEVSGWRHGRESEVEGGSLNQESDALGWFREEKGSDQCALHSRHGHHEARGAGWGGDDEGAIWDMKVE